MKLVLRDVQINVLFLEDSIFMSIYFIERFVVSLTNSRAKKEIFNRNRSVSYLYLALLSLDPMDPKKEENRLMLLMKMNHNHKPPSL